MEEIRHQRERLLRFGQMEGVPVRVRHCFEDQQFGLSPRAPQREMHRAGAAQERIARAAAYLGIRGGFDGFQKAVLKLRKELKVPHTLGGLVKAAADAEAAKPAPAKPAPAKPKAITRDNDAGGTPAGEAAE